MPRAKQISAWVEDRPGTLGKLADALGEKGVTIRAFMAASMDGRGFVRLVVDRPGAAKRVLTAHGWETTVDEVVEVTVPDKPGAVGKVADRLGEAGINVQYAYVGSAGSARTMNLYLAVPDVKAALKALR
ncbi:ACT domain-containing protein [Anaeromyxobacter sp. Fw109-5]|uniref:ACT domain-containing protein n=1 Tax=Anaeromyxobacter sp. (strain Fw109-5) TaxID=404589 RepID=UPI0000ED748A|nr:ACT domain-containing protein [Anaeromyxobacter sp. Fw109-5]ABS26598.1 amino acid-binding ACT domain protein [Anaeromyxobacter sp. Fw109-5]